MTKLLIAALTIASALQAQAQTKPTYEQLGFSSETEMTNYFTVTDVKVTDIAIDDSKLGAPVVATPGAAALGGGLLDALGPVLLDPSGVSGWIAFGKKVWEVVVANKPVVNVQSTRISVLPNDKSAWAQMSGWRGPRGAAYEITAVNGFGTQVIDQKYTVTYNYGGNLNGKGRYLANVAILPRIVEVGWGYTLNSSVEVGQIVNTGTVESPVPQVELDLKWNMKTILKETQGLDSFVAKGDGSLQHVSK